MMDTCKTCAHWDAEGVGSPPSLEGASDHRPCKCPKTVNAADLQWWAGMAADKHLASNTAIYPESEGRVGQLCTGPEFGCVNHSVR